MTVPAPLILITPRIRMMFWVAAATAAVTVIAVATLPRVKLAAEVVVAVAPFELRAEYRIDVKVAVPPNKSAIECDVVPDVSI